VLSWVICSLYVLFSAAPVATRAGQSGFNSGLNNPVESFELAFAQALANAARVACQNNEKTNGNRVVTGKP
jgi:hypothetical protein